MSTYTRFNGRHRAGTSLVELLVVIVIFLIGILAVVQIFPGGFKILNTSKKNTVATQLAREWSDYLKGRPDLLPELIMPVSYSFSGGNTIVVADSNTDPDDLGPFTGFIDADGDILDSSGGDKLGSWRYLSGVNNFRRVIGEGGPVPAPRNVAGQYGGLRMLLFAPTLLNSNFVSLFQIYGNNLQRRFGNPGFARTTPYIYYVEDPDQPGAMIHIPRDAAKNKNYKLAFNAWINNGGNTYRRDVVNATVSVAMGNGFHSEPLSNYAGLSGGESFVGADYGTIRLARLFDAQPGAFTADPYEYKLVNGSLGLILFNPEGHNYLERRSNGRRVPLVAKVDYDVYDWRNLREEFRIPDAYEAETRLKLGSLKHLNKMDADRTRFSGLPVSVPDEAGGSEFRDFILVDLATGGIYSKQSLDIEYVLGWVRFNDADNDPSNGIQAGLIPPGGTTPVTVNATGRSVRAIYQVTGEWAVQVLKAADQYLQALTSPGAGQFYAGGSGAYYLGGAVFPGESLTRVYFAPMHAEEKVTVSELWYDDGGAEPKKLAGQEFIIRRASAGDPVGLPYIDIRDADSNALNLNYARYGYAVKGIKGASMTVRVAWNPETFRITGDEGVNLDEFEQWGRNWRISQVQTILQKGAQE